MLSGYLRFIERLTKMNVGYTCRKWPRGNLHLRVVHTNYTIIYWRACLHACSMLVRLQGTFVNNEKA